MQLWSGKDIQIVGGPAISADGPLIAFSVRQADRTLLHSMVSDGSRIRVVCDSLHLHGASSIAPDGRFVIYSGPDVGTKFSVNAIGADKTVHSLPPLVLTRGARHLVLLPGGRKLIFLQGEMQHKNLWMVDVETDATEQLTHMPGDFDIRNFDVSLDVREAVLERAQARSGVVMIEWTSSWSYSF